MWQVMQSSQSPKTPISIIYKLVDGKIYSENIFSSFQKKPEYRLWKEHLRYSDKNVAVSVT